MTTRYRLPALWDGELGEPGAWWDVGFDRALFSFTARMEVDPADDDGVVEPVSVIGTRFGEYLEPSLLEDAMSFEDQLIVLGAVLEAKLIADRDRVLGPNELRYVCQRVAEQAGQAVPLVDRYSFLSAPYGRI